MKTVLDITLKDLLQILRDRKVFLFLLIMPIAFTLLFGYAFSGTGSESDSRLPVGYLNQDGDSLSLKLEAGLADSSVIRVVYDPESSVADLEKQVANEKLAGAIFIPEGYSQAILAGNPIPVTVIADPTAPAGASVMSEVQKTLYRLMEAVRTAQIISQLDSEMFFDPVLDSALQAWQEPPIKIQVRTKALLEEQSDLAMSAAHSSPGMMLQFAIAGLLTSAQVLVNERKSRCLQRLLTTATRRSHILLGHYLAIFSLIFTQFIVLIIFGQIVLKLDYLGEPVATLLMAFSAALCIAALGLLIGVLARSEEEAVTFSLIPMFVLSGLGGAWVPLEFTGETFQAIGHLSPVAWAMDGFKNIVARGLGLDSVVWPAIALVGYAVVFFLLSIWRLRTASE